MATKSFYEHVVVSDPKTVSMMKKDLESKKVVFNKNNSFSNAGEKAYQNAKKWNI